MKWLIWEQKADGKYVYDVIDTEEEARKIAECSRALFYCRTAGVKWKKGERIAQRIGTWFAYGE